MQHLDRSHRVLPMLAGCLLLAAWGAGAAHAEPARAPAKPAQLSLTEEWQLFDQRVGVAGVRLAALSARNSDVEGLDLALLAGRSSGDQVGLQASLYCEVEGDLEGVQLGMLSADTDGTATGLQTGLITRAGAMTGLQLAAFYNRALAVTGVQLSLVNYAEDLEGVQIGLVNVHRNGRVPALPLLNWGF